MPMFHYSAVTPGGELDEGVMEALDEAHVIALLQRVGKIPMRAERANNTSKLSASFFGKFTRRGLRRQEVANFTRELAIMLGAGQTLDRALRFQLNNSPSHRMNMVLLQLQAGLRNGGSLASALERNGNSFSPAYVGLIRAGEAGGTLIGTLERLALLLERQRRLTATVRAAMVYPTVMAFVATGSVTVLITVVLPKFLPLFTQNDTAPPASLQTLLGIGAFIGTYGIYLMLGLLGLALTARHALSKPAIRLMVDRFWLRLPVIAPLLQEVLAARFTQTLGALLMNGVPLIASLEITRDVVGNLAAKQAVEAMTVSAKGGAGVSPPLATAGVFPLRMVQLLQLGEQTAQLGEIALRAADIHDERVQAKLQQLVALLVPVITIAMGAIIGTIVSSLVVAMLSLNNLGG